MVWRIVKDTLLVGKYGPSSVTGKVAQQKRRIAAFDFVCPYHSSSSESASNSSDDQVLGFNTSYIRLWQGLQPGRE